MHEVEKFDFINVKSTIKIKQVIIDRIKINEIIERSFF